MPKIQRVEVPVTRTVTKRVEVPGPERVRVERVEVPVPGPERIREVKVPDPTVVAENNSLRAENERLARQLKEAKATPPIPMAPEVRISRVEQERRVAEAREESKRTGVPPAQIYRQRMREEQEQVD